MSCTLSRCRKLKPNPNTSYNDKKVVYLVVKHTFTKTLNNNIAYLFCKILFDK